MRLTVALFIFSRWLISTVRIGRLSGVKERRIAKAFSIEFKAALADLKVSLNAMAGWSFKEEDRCTHEALEE